MLAHALDILALGLDSLAAGWLLGPSLRRGRYMPAALGFGLCDAAGSALGDMSDLLTGRIAITLAILAACGVALIGHRTIIRSGSVLVCLFPVLLGLDSLLFPVPFEDTMGLGIASAALAFCGLYAGSVSFATYGHHPAWRAAFVLVPVVAIMF